MPKCLLIYIGNGYSQHEMVYDNCYSYSCDMRENYENHQEKIIEPLKKRGYKVDIALLTNKHEKYDEFVEYYNAIPLDYEDFNEEDGTILTTYYNWRSDIAPGMPKSGGRFLKLKEEIPNYDIYVIVRADLHFKLGLNQLNVDYKKMNWLWPETYYLYFTEFREDFLKEYKTEFYPWQNFNRVNGNCLNVIPFKFFRTYSKYIWMEHNSLNMMIQDLYPLITLEDVNLMAGYEKSYVTDVRFSDNPVYITNKKIISSGIDINVSRFGVK